MNNKKNPHPHLPSTQPPPSNPPKNWAPPPINLTSKWIQDATRNASSTLPPATAPTPPPRFYTQDGLHIPLYNAAGKRITHARDGRVLLHKHNKKLVLDDVVRKYAGEKAAREMESWTKDRIGDWITEVETRAFGNPPRGKAGTKDGEGKKDGNGKKEGGRKKGGEGKKDPSKATKSPGLPSGSLRRMSMDMATGEEEEEEEIQGRVTRSMSEQTRALLGMENGEEAGLSSSLPTQGTTPTATTTTTTTNGHPLLPPSSLAPKRKLTDPTTDQPPKRQKPTPTTPLKPNPPPDSFPWPPSDPSLPPPRSTSLVHPRAPRALALSPKWTPLLPTSTSTSTPLRVLPLRASQSHTLVLSTPLSLHILSLPHHDLASQRAAQSLGKKIPPPHRRTKSKRTPNPLVDAYLKEGRHGYDWEEHRWGFEGDGDLVTGVGHQVGEGDREAYGRGELWGKYGGRRGGVWPCGCRVVSEEGEGEESEEE